MKRLLLTAFSVFLMMSGTALAQDGHPGDVVIPLESFVLMESERSAAALSPAARNGMYTAAPAMQIDNALTYDAVFVLADPTDSNREIRIRLFDDHAPITVNNFVVLALDGYYDGVTFHRVIADFMAQGGDPTGVGNGSPGYQFVDEVDNGLEFDRRGLLAMANAGAGTNGSQFFITFVETSWLTGNHTIFGQVVAGDEVLAGISLRNPLTATTAGDIIERVDIYSSDAEPNPTAVSVREMQSNGQPVVWVVLGGLILAWGSIVVGINPHAGRKQAKAS